MNIFETACLRPIQVVPKPKSRLIVRDYLSRDEPVIFDRFDEGWSCAKKWTLDYIGAKAGTITTGRPSDDGVYRFHSVHKMPFAEFAKSLHTTKDIYLALDPIYRTTKKPYVPEGLRPLFHDLEVPDFVDEKRLKQVNLWVGPGGNNTLLHYDPWHGLLIMLKGRKRLALFGPRETTRMYGYSPFNVVATFRNRVLDSRINPKDIPDGEYRKLGQATGYEAVLEEGQAILIPAGHWHYVESEGINVAVNFFWSDKRWRHHLHRPLIDYWVKRLQVEVQEVLKRFIRAYIFPKRPPKMRDSG